MEGKEEFCHHDKYIIMCMHLLLTLKQEHKHSREEGLKNTIKCNINDIIYYEENKSTSSRFCLSTCLSLTVV